MLDEASWLLSHAQALTDCGRQDEAAAELARAASCEEQAAGLLAEKMDTPTGRKALARQLRGSHPTEYRAAI